MKRSPFIKSLSMSILSIFTLHKIFKKEKKQEKKTFLDELREIIKEGDLERTYIKKGYTKTKPNEGMAINNDVELIFDLLYGHSMWVNTKKKIYSITDEKVKRPKHMVTV